jgi:hypothetical protein
MKPWSYDEIVTVSRPSRPKCDPNDRKGRWEFEMRPQAQAVCLKRAQRVLDVVVQLEMPMLGPVVVDFLRHLEDTRPGATHQLDDPLRVPHEHRVVIEVVFGVEQPDAPATAASKRAISTGIPRRAQLS